MCFSQIYKITLLTICGLFLFINVSIAQHDHSHEDHSILVATDALGEVNFTISGSAEAQRVLM